MTCFKRGFVLHVLQACPGSKGKHGKLEQTSETNWSFSNYLGMKASKRGDFKIAIEFYQLALRIAKDTGNKDQEATIYNNLGSAYQSLSDFKKAIEFCQLALRIAKDTGNKDQEGTTYNLNATMVRHKRL